jgi:hypothetical protein
VDFSLVPPDLEAVTAEDVPCFGDREIVVETLGVVLGLDQALCVEMIRCRSTFGASAQNRKY